MLNRFAAKRDTNEKQIVAYLKSFGCSVYRLSGSGIADLLIGFANHDFKLEIKSKSGRLTKAQLAMEQDWKGAPAHIIRSLDDVDELFRREGLIE